jgi:phage I-like protein
MMDYKQTQPLSGAGIGFIAMALASTDTELQAEQWIHLLPAGEFRARDGRGPWMLSDADAVILASAAYAGLKTIPVDYDHQIDNAIKNGQPAPAAGWIKRLESRADGLWGLVEWTEKAMAHLSAKEYRYLSPVFNFTPNGKVTRVLRAALTNNPALELTALASAQATDAPAPDTLVELRGLLGLADDADMAAIIEGVRNLMAATASTKPDLDQFVPIDAHQAVLAAAQTMLQQAEETAMATSVDQAIQQGHILEHHREFALELCRSAPGKFDQFVASVSPFLKGIRGMQTGGLAPELRGSAKPARHLDETDKAVCRALGHSQEEFIQLGVTHAD